MKFGMTGVSGVLASLALVLAGLTAPAARAAAAPVRVDVTNLLAIQTFNPGEKAEDDVYLLVHGVARGEEFQARVPKDGTLKAAPKKSPITDKTPAALWTGELADGEFALVTVTLMHGKGAAGDAKVKDFTDKLSAAEKKVADRAKKSLTADEFKKFAKDNLKAQRGVVTGVRDVLGRDKGGDHYGGLFNLLLWNNAGKLTKRLDPVGLTFGEDNGTDVKVYTKLKNTRGNAFVLEPRGEWTQRSLFPLNDDLTAVRVKSLENEEIKGEKKTTDYLTEIQVRDLTGGGDGKALKWKLSGEESGVDEIHTYWNWAE